MEYSQLRIASPVLRTGQPIKVSAGVANREPSVTETVQLRAHLVASVAQPVGSGFQRVSIGAGESRP